jgi:hypothetical protein
MEVVWLARREISTWGAGSLTVVALTTSSTSTMCSNLFLSRHDYCMHQFADDVHTIVVRNSKQAPNLVYSHRALHLLSNYCRTIKHI